MMGLIYDLVMENQYLDLIKNVLANGERRADRTGTGVLSVFAPGVMRFNLGEGSFPLLTTKFVSMRLVFEELLWFVRGKTDGMDLKAKGVTIWANHGTREYLDSICLLGNKEDDLGPIYGFQWRHWGAEYVGCDENYIGKGVDQLVNVVEAIMFNPWSRRIIMTAWNVGMIDQMALPPCHMTVQFFVGNISLAAVTTTKRVLNCQVYQRSGDVGLGVPFNIASYSLLLRILAHAVGYDCGTFTYVLGDAHIYDNHADELRTQAKRVPHDPPTMTILKTLDFKQFNGLPGDTIAMGVVAWIEALEWKDIKMGNYLSAKKIPLNISV